MNHRLFAEHFAASLKTSILLICIATLSGCAASRSEIRLSTPAATPARSASSDAMKVAVIRSITDERVFEEKPSDPSIPSLGSGGAAKASADVKARAIGRKRNTYGMAMGDVLLESGQTVTGVVRENLTAALAQAGYQVKDAKDAGPNPLLIDVRVKQLWAWFKPGFISITLNANVVTDLQFSGSVAPLTINVHAEDSRQMAMDSAWMEIVGKALDQYRAQVAAKMAATAPAAMK